MNKAPSDGCRQEAISRIEVRTYDEVGTKLQVESCSTSINHCTCAENQLWALLVSPLYQLAENLVSEVTTVSKLEYAYATLVASLDYVLTNFTSLLKNTGTIPVSFMAAMTSLC